MECAPPPKTAYTLLIIYQKVKDKPTVILSFRQGLNLKHLRFFALKYRLELRMTIENIRMCVFVTLLEYKKTAFRIHFW